MIVVESLSSKLEWDLAQVLCFRSLLLSHKTISGQQRSYVARSVAMQSEWVNATRQKNPVNSGPYRRTTGDKSRMEWRLRALPN